MGNRAVITTPEKKIGVYLHWNGGRGSVEGFLEYCKRAKFRAPTEDCSGWSRLCQVIANFFGPGGTSVGIDLYERLDTDNGVYIIDGWKIVGREHAPEDEDMQKDPEAFLKAVADAQPQVKP